MSCNKCEVCGGKIQRASSEVGFECANCGTKYKNSFDFFISSFVYFFILINLTHRVKDYIVTRFMNSEYNIWYNTLIIIILYSVIMCPTYPLFLKLLEKLGVGQFKRAEKLPENGMNDQQKVSTDNTEPEREN